MKVYKDIDSYIRVSENAVRPQLRLIRATIHKVAPHAVEAISYGLPTFKLNGNLVHFAAWKKHIALYPGSASIKLFAKELKKYETSKGTIQFPLEKKLPLSLIRKIVTQRVMVQMKKTLKKK